jgi:hypothetical protein
MSISVGRAVLASLVLASGLSFAAPASAQSEATFQKRFCKGMVMKKYLPSGTYVDCISETHAIEVDFTNHWAEAIGQSLFYASELEKLPGIILVCRPHDRDALCLKHAYHIEQAVTYWRIGMTLWLCEASARSLDECRREELMGP